MARTGGNRGSGNSKLRFIMLEADVVDGDFSQITQAITNALRPPSRPAPRLLGGVSRPAEVGSVGDDSEDLDAEVVEEDDEISVTPPSPRGEARARKYRSPNILPLDLTTAPSFADFAAKKAPHNDQKKYLVVAAWFKHERGIDEISMDHVYNCFRAVKWNTSNEDFDAPLRSLKNRKLLDKGTGRGMYAINHLGIAEVDALGVPKGS